MPAPDTLRPRGRPRGFELETALDAATRTFWARGYDGTSIDALCQVMSMPRASMYQAFGGKEGLFLAAIAHYAETRVIPVMTALAPKGTLVEDLAAFYAAVIGLATADAATPGCLISCVLTDVAGTNDLFRAELDQRLGAVESRIADRLSLASPQADVSGAAAMAGAVAQGIMVRARSGASADMLAPVAATAVAALGQLFP